MRVCRGAQNAFGNPALFQDGVCGVPGFDVVVDDDRTTRLWAKPNLVIASALSVEPTAGSPKEGFHLPRIVRGHRLLGGGLEAALQHEMNLGTKLRRQIRAV
jgi:hypothetical protein